MPPISTIAMRFSEPASSSPAIHPLPLPAIGRSLDNIDDLSWVVTSYLLAATAATPLFGKLTDIQHTITVGVRSTAADTRTSQMPAFGRDAILKPQQIGDLTEYVVHLSGRPADAGAIKRAAPLFADNCAACHGAQGKGDRQFGAPNLTDNEWLYGSARDDIQGQIWNGHGGVMPTWGGRLSPETIKSLAVYVHGLGGGE